MQHGVLSCLSLGWIKVDCRRDHWPKRLGTCSGLREGRTMKGFGWRRMRSFLMGYQYLNERQLNGFEQYEYRGVDTNPFNNSVSMPLCDRIVAYIPSWLAPNVLTVATFVLSFVQYLILAFYDYDLTSSSIEVTYRDHIPDWVWLLSGLVLLAAIALDALDGKHARRIGACSPVGEILDHSIDWWRLTAPMITCFYSIFGRMEFGLPAYRLAWLLVASQSVVLFMFWHQYVTGVLIYSWGYDLMQYLAAFYYLFTYFHEDGAEWWQREAYDIFSGTNAVVTERFAYLMVFGIALPMQFYYSLRYELHRTADQRSFKDIRPLLAPLALFATTVVLTWQNPFDSIIETDPRASLWLIGIVFCDMMWRLLVGSMTKSECPTWNHLLSFFVLCCVYWFLRPRSLLRWDTVTVRTAAVIATAIHLHRVVCTLNQMCRHFRIRMFFVGANTMDSGFERNKEEDSEELNRLRKPTRDTQQA